METAEKLITENLDVWTPAVKAKSSAGRGSSKKRELHGIGKLRGLILDLAVRGMLVPHDLEDEPASELLKKIAAERSKLTKQGKLKKQKKLTEIAESDQPFSIPPSWEWIRLGNATNYGVSDKAEANDVDEDTWVLELEDVEKSTSKLLKKVRFRERNFKSSKNRFNKSDVIYGKLRPYLDRVLVVDEPGVCTTEMIPVRAYISIEPTFLRWAMKSPYFIRYANASTHGMNLPRMGTDKARLALIPLAPEKEQLRIVAKVDELMALCDQLEQEQTRSLDTHDTLVATLLGALTTATADASRFAEAWQRIQANFDTLFTTESSIDQLKQTILQLAVMGKLVEQDPADEAAATTLERIATQRAELIKAGDLKKRKLLPPISKNEEPSKLPDPWQWCRLDVLITDMDAGWSPACPPTPSPSHDIWGVLKTTAVQVMEYREIENKVLDGSKSPRPQYEVRSGDILITRAGPKNRVGISCLVENTRPRLMISDKIIRFHLVEVGISERFISLCLNAGPTWDYLENAKSGMAESQMNISQGKLRAAPIPLAPLDEQHRIVAKVDELMTLCDQLKAGLATAQATQLNLADSLVEQAIN